VNPGLAHLLQWTRPHAGRIALAFLLGAATVGSSIGLMATSAYLLSAAALHPSIAELSLAIVGVRAFGLARGVFRYLERIITHTLNLRLLGTLRVWVYQTIEPLAPARLVDARSGDLLARAVTDIDSLQDFYARVLAPPAVAVAVAAGTAVYLGSHDLRLAVTFLILFTVAGVLLPAGVRSTARAPAQACSRARAALSAQIVVTLQGLPDLTAFSAQAPFADRLRAANRNLTEAQRQWAWLQSAPAAASGLLAQLAAAATLAWGVYLTAAGRMDGIALGAITLAALAAFEAAAALPAAALSSESVLAAAGRIFSLAELRPAVDDPADPRPAPDPSAGLHLCVRDLRFRYPGQSRDALDGFNLDLAPGRRVAIVGPSSAGKSTLARLLLRLWEYTDGEITLNGIELRALQTEAARSLFAAMLQPPTLFNTTLRENLLLGRPGSCEADLRGVLERVQLGSMLASLPRGLETRVGEGGAAVSAGERQRLALARTLLQSAAILVLDEPTAHLDPVTERAVLAGLTNLPPHQSLLMITHRLVGLDSMDEIVVLADGRIAERGTHGLLSKAGGMYQHMLGMQNRAWDVLGVTAITNGGV